MKNKYIICDNCSTDFDLKDNLHDIHCLVEEVVIVTIMCPKCKELYPSYIKDKVALENMKKIKALDNKIKKLMNKKEFFEIDKVQRKRSKLLKESVETSNDILHRRNVKTIIRDEMAALRNEKGGEHFD